MWGGLIKIFKIFNEISNHGRHFKIFLLQLENNCQGRYIKKAKSINALDLFPKRKLYVGNELPKKIKIAIVVKKNIIYVGNELPN